MLVAGHRWQPIRWTGTSQLLGLKVGFLAPVIATMAAIGFCTMGAVIGRVWFLAAADFALAGLFMSLPVP